ncbi:MAG: iron-containing alcohol dehydrogenase [Clostridia bacterium]|nr:iron-containing alcohol dehydrogenase [Clostridia bacterium]
MNSIMKFYCRAFQFCFKMAIPILPYRNPRVLHSVSGVGKALKKKGYDNVLIVTDKVIRDIEFFKKLEEGLKEHDIIYTVFDKTVPNPTIENVEEAKGIYMEKGCQALVAIGGGSSIDCAKAVGARLVKKNQRVQKMAGILKIHKKIPFLVAIPTTAGTGSEVTVTTVITDEVTKHKSPISDFCLIPCLAVLDSDATKTLPEAIVATTGMDALTHAVEAYIGNSTTKSTRADAIEALNLIFENLYKAYTDKSDEEARGRMLKASFLAGRAFSKSYVGYCHAVAHSLGGEYNIPHGLANAVLLPYTLEEYGESAHKKLCSLAKATGLCNDDAIDSEGAEAFIEKLKEMNKSMGIPDKLKGIKTEDIPRLAAYAAKEANPLYPVPRLMDAKELEKLYHKVMED